MSATHSKLDLDPGVIASCREAAAQIAGQVGEEIAGKTTVSVERTVARLLGVDGVNELDAPLPNVLVDHVADRGELGRGIGYWLGNALLDDERRSPQQIAQDVDSGKLDLCALPRAEDGAIKARIARECDARLAEISAQTQERHELRERLGERPPPLRYVLTATGNVYEDVVHGLAVAEAGGDIVAVIRSTAQSLLDYVPYGPTTEGYGGTFATQANFRIMREALDEWSREHGRYVRLSSFCSGLCMPEIAAMGAIEGFDNMVNDALYGILYRDINPIRGLIDQRVSRMVNGYFGVTINTGEDNYLRTADAIEAAPSVTASQFINRQLALDSGVPDAQIALGDAFEIDPPVRQRPAVRVGAGAADARAVPGLPGQVHAPDAAHGRQPVPHARDRLAVQPRHDRHRPGHPDDRGADRGDLHAPRARPRDRPGKRRTTCSTPRATSARRSSSSLGASSRRARARSCAGRTSCWSGSPRSGCSRRSARACSATSPARSARAGGSRGSSRPRRTTSTR